MTYRIAVSALTGRIYMGKANKQGTAFTGTKSDVTSDVMKAIIDKAAYHGDDGFEINTDVDCWEVTVKKIDLKPATQL